MQELAVQFKHISMEFPGVLANDDVSRDIRRGEVFALVGENEMAEKKVTLKNMTSGEQQLLAIEEAIHCIKRG